MHKKTPLIIALLLLLSSISKPVIASTINTASLYTLKKEFVNLRFAMFIHFNMATYENNTGTSDWGSAQANPALFNPTALNCNQWAQAALSAKMTSGCLTVKHHDGFCIYHSAFGTYHCNDNTPDVVQAFVDAFRNAGLQPGLYFSMLDLNQNIANGTCTAAKKQFIKNQLQELLTHYGDIPYIVFDGWNAPWGGPNYDELPFEEIKAYITSIQPQCLLVNISCEPNETHTDIVMFENGAGQYTPTWFDRAGIDCYQLQQGYWFWKATMPTGSLNSVEFIVNQHLKPLNAQNQVYIINCAPNPAGTLDQNVITRLTEIGNAWTKPPDLDTIPLSWYPDYAIAKNLAYGKRYKQSSTVYDGHAVRALDGYTDGNWDHASVTHTNIEKNAWWQVDLESSHAISSIEIWNRTDAVVDRLNDYWVFISNNPFSDTDNPSTLGSRTDVWKIHMTSYPKPSTAIPVPDYTGRYVRIQLNGTNYLSLAEVKVLSNNVTKNLSSGSAKSYINSYPAVFKVAGSHFIVPKELTGQRIVVYVYTLSGKLLGKIKIQKNNTIDLSEFSKSRNLVIVNIRAMPKSY